MREFLNEDFLLYNETAQTLYHNYAKQMPIIDFHSHLSAKEIYENKQFNNITEVWLGGDHYKWRAMRTLGVSEDAITGTVDSEEKFNEWAKSMPYLIGNPLYHWTHLELQRYFNIKTSLSAKTAKDIYEECNRLLATPEYRVRGLIDQMNVDVICTTDDPCDDLKYHQLIRKEGTFKTKILPTFRPDKAANTKEEVEKYKTQMYLFLGEQYHKRGWVMQFHIGAMRNNNTTMLEKLGPDTGYDSINNSLDTQKLSKFLNALNVNGNLPKTIIYDLNPSDNHKIVTLMQCFQDGMTPGKIQFGSAWWFNDHKDGMNDQMRALAANGVLSKFVGMLTDSRSFLSFPRHEYFRRLLCQLLGEYVELGEYPADMDLLGQIVQDICYYNSKQFFNLID